VSLTWQPMERPQVRGLRAYRTRSSCWRYVIETTYREAGDRFVAWHYTLDDMPIRIGEFLAFDAATAACQSFHDDHRIGEPKHAAGSVRA
jgi:hypothetical protein